jgi:hypothetical protein
MTGGGDYSRFQECRLYAGLQLARRAARLSAYHRGGRPAWEAAHLPLYTLWQTGTSADKIFALVHCTFGDLLIALATLTLGLLLAGHRDWPVRRFAAVAAITLTLGLGYAVFSEWLNIVVRKSWAYSSLMPVISLFNLSIGISPLLQWMVVPTLAFIWRVVRGRTMIVTDRAARLSLGHSEELRLCTI